MKQYKIRLWTVLQRGCNKFENLFNCLKHETYSIHKNSVPTSKKSYVYLTNTNGFMLFRETAVYCKSQINRINRQNAEFLNARNQTTII